MTVLPLVQHCTAPVLPQTSSRTCLGPRTAQGSTCCRQTQCRRQNPRCDCATAAFSYCCTAALTSSSSQHQPALHDHGCMCFKCAPSCLGCGELAKSWHARCLFKRLSRMPVLVRGDSAQLHASRNAHPIPWRTHSRKILTYATIQYSLTHSLTQHTLTHTTHFTGHGSSRDHFLPQAQPNHSDCGPLCGLPQAADPTPGEFCVVLFCIALFCFVCIIVWQVRRGGLQFCADAFKGCAGMRFFGL